MESSPPLSRPERRIQRERRRYSVRSLLFGGVRPRRRLVRRSGEGHLGFLDWHESRLLYLALTVLLLSCADALFTLNLITLGAREANAFMDSLLSRGVANFLTVKLALTGCGVVILVCAAHRSFLGWFRVIRLLQLACIGYVALIAYEIYLFTIVLAPLSGSLGWSALFG